MVQDQNKFFTDTAAEHSTMYQMASDTGGHAYVDTNGLSEAVGNAIEEGSNYYTLAYTPTNPRQDGKFHKIKVQLSPGRDTTSPTASGYFADDPDHLKSKHAAELAAHGIAQSAHHPRPKPSCTARPDGTEDLAQAPEVLPANTAVEDKTVTGNIFSPAQATRLNMQGSLSSGMPSTSRPIAKDIQITPTPDGHYPIQRPRF